jgi:hypothetical protein
MFYGYHGSSDGDLEGFDFGAKKMYFFSLNEADWCYIDVFDNPGEYVSSKFVYEQMLDTSKLLHVNDISQMKDEDMVGKSGVVVTQPRFDREHVVPYVVVWGEDAFDGKPSRPVARGCVDVERFERGHEERDYDYDEDVNYNVNKYVLGFHTSDGKKVHRSPFVRPVTLGSSDIKPEGCMWYSFGKRTFENYRTYELERRERKYYYKQLIRKSELIHIASERDVMLFTSKYASAGRPQERTEDRETSRIRQIDWDRVRRETGKSGIALYVEDKDEGVQWALGWNVASVAVWDARALGRISNPLPLPEKDKDVVVVYSWDDYRRDVKALGTRDSYSMYHLKRPAPVEGRELVVGYVSSSTLVNLKTDGDVVHFYSKYYSHVKRGIDWEKVIRNTMKFGIAVHAKAILSSLWSSEDTWDVPFVAVWNSNALLNYE